MLIEGSVESVRDDAAVGPAIADNLLWAERPLLGPNDAAAVVLRGSAPAATALGSADP